MASTSKIMIMLETMRTDFLFLLNISYTPVRGMLRPSASVYPLPVICGNNQKGSPVYLG